jgi:hypothetical protein
MNCAREASWRRIPYGSITRAADASRAVRTSSAARGGQREQEHRAVDRRSHQFEPAAVRLGNPPRDREAEAGATQLRIVTRPRGVGPHECEAGLVLHHGDGGAELVGCIGHELPLAREGALKTAEQFVDHARKLSDFVGWVGHRRALAEIRPPERGPVHRAAVPWHARDRREDSRRRGAYECAAQTRRRPPCDAVCRCTPRAGSRRDRGSRPT